MKNSHPQFVVLKSFLRSSKCCLLALALCFLQAFVVQAQEVVPIYSGAIPNAKEMGKKESYGNGMFRGVTKPTLEIYLPAKEKSTGTAIVIVPGGGYSVVVYDGEGRSTAKRFAEKGIAAFVLKYRLPDDSTMVDKTIGPLQDAQQAIKFVRENADRWGVDKKKIGIIGFSAGGHLAATAATQFATAQVENAAGTSLRPDFQVLVYPVISMQDSLTHPDSRKALLGASPTDATKRLYSAEQQVTADSPPAYLTHATDDALVDVANSTAYFNALRQKKVPVEMHVYQKGGHGFIFRQPDWMDPLFLWLKKNGWMP
jgi:acetyl esterase/lipase